jgi:16S rRNA (uracil1498-N3)-methyltransferase
MSDCLDRFWIPGVSQRDRVEVPKDEGAHIIRVLRMGEGDELTAFDGTGSECRCRIAAVRGKWAVVDVIERREISREAPVSVVLAIAAPKAKAMDLAVQKCTELGFARLIPFESARSVAKVTGKSKTEKWRRTAIEACKQCGRNVLPGIDEPTTLSDLSALVTRFDAAVTAAAGEETMHLKGILNEHPKAGSVLCIIGPEGGFEGDEIATLADAGAPAVSLGRSILRVETAAIAALGMIIYHYSAMT